MPDLKKGFFIINRALLDHPTFKGRPDRIGAFVVLIGKAAYRDTTIDVRGEAVAVKRGELVASQATLTKWTGLERQQLRSFLRALESTGAINQASATGVTKGVTKLTLCNYDKYQGSTPSENQAPTKPPTNKRNNINNPSNEGDAATPPSEPIEVSVVTKAVWNCKPFLERHGVSNPGAMIGRWLKDSNPYEILRAIEAAQKAGTEDPVPYIQRVLSGQNSENDAEMQFFKDVAEGNR